MIMDSLSVKITNISQRYQMSMRKSEKGQRQSSKLSSALTNAVVIVTGASSGIGAATAREFARRIEELAAQQQTITGEGHLAFAIPTDITDATQITKLVDQR